MENEEDLKKITNNRLIKKLEEEIREYSAWVAKNYSLAEGREEEVMVIVIERDLIHDEIAELNARGLEYDVTDLKLIDKKWQAQYAQGVAEQDQIGIRRSDVPKKHWWWWIDHLEDLSPEERSTI
jgi:hypothetical protein